MTLDAFVAKYNGKTNYDYDGIFPGECVDVAKAYLRDCHGINAGAWGDAKNYFVNPTLLSRFDAIPYPNSRRPKRGDIVVWGASLPGSGKAGHVAVCLSTGSSTFVSLDQNWGGRYVHQVTHNFNNVVGWLSPRTAAPVPPPQPKPQGGNNVAEKITVDTSRILQHGVLARNGIRGRANSLNGSMGDPWVGTDLTNKFITDIFLSDEARGWRDSNSPSSIPDINIKLEQNAQLQPQLARQQEIINQQNVTITDLTNKLTSPELTDDQKKEVLTEAVESIGTQNAQLANTHDKMTDVKINPAPPAPTEKGAIAKLWDFLTKKR